MTLANSEIAKMIDLSAVRAEHGEVEIAALAEAARRYRVGSVHTLPAFVSSIRWRVADLLPGLVIGAPVGFPSGGQTMLIKVAEAHQLLSLGCSEIDMVINIGRLRSGQWAEVQDEINAVVDAAEGHTVKVILECCYLDADQIRRGCDLAIAGGARFVKTGTGWAPGATMPDLIALIKAHVGDAIGIKAAGGIRSLDALLEMYRLGARRFGIGFSAIKKVLQEAEK